jgi:hypothetical protein
MTNTMTNTMFSSLQRKGFITEITSQTFGENVRYINNSTITLSIMKDEDFGDTYLVTSRVWGGQDRVQVETEDATEAVDTYRDLLEHTRRVYEIHAENDPLNHMS